MVLTLIDLFIYLLSVVVSHNVVIIHIYMHTFYHILITYYYPYKFFVLHKHNLYMNKIISILNFIQINPNLIPSMCQQSKDIFTKIMNN